MIKIKATAFLIFSRLKKKAQRLIRRCPRQVKVFAAPIAGALIGLTGGIAGSLIGLLLGYMLGKLFIQLSQDTKILDYLKNPGLQEFYEGEAGLAAWCALGVLVAYTSHAKLIKANSPDSPKGKKEGSLSSPYTDKIIRQLMLESSRAFDSPLADPHLVEHFSRLALSVRINLNQDLLAESLVARRYALGDLRKLGRSLFIFAEEKSAHVMVKEIYLILDPDAEAEVMEELSGDDNSQGENRSGAQGKIANDPWRILGLPPGTPLEEVKAHYRRLVKQFHPDELDILEPKHKEAAARAFIAIKEAYRQIAEGNV